MRLAMRNRAFLFFSMIMPLVFLFIYAGILGRGNPEALPYLLADVLALTVMGSFWGLSVQLVTFREQGILRRFRIAPVGAGSMLASSILSNYLMLLPTIAIEMLVCRLAFHLRAWGNLWAIFLLVTIGSATFSAFGLIVASVTNTMQETQVINQLIWTAFLFLSGASVPLAIFPHWIQGAALFMPATYLATGLQAAASGVASSSELISDFVALAIGLLVAFEVSRQLFRWEPEAKIPRNAKLWAAATALPFLLLGVWENGNGKILSQAQGAYRSLDQRPSSSSPEKK